MKKSNFIVNFFVFLYRYSENIYCKMQGRPQKWLYLQMTRGYPYDHSRGYSGEMTYREIMEELYRDSQYYPEVHVISYEHKNRIQCTLYASTIVRIKREDTWYRVHCVESIMPSKRYTVQHLLQKLIISAYKIQYLYELVRINNGEVVNGRGILQQYDDLNISEAERIKTL